MKKFFIVLLSELIFLISVSGFCAENAEVKRYIQDLKSGKPEVIKHAIEGLGRIGEPAVRSLIEILKNKEGISNYAAKSLGLIGKPAIPSLIEAIKGEDYDVVLYTKSALCQIADTSAVPILVEILKNERDDIRSYAAEALGNIGDKLAVPALIEALKDNNSNVKVSAAKSLGKIGDKSAIPALISKLKNDHDWSTVEALGDIGDTSVIPVLIESLKNEDGAIRSSAAKALGKMGGKFVVPMLMSMLENDEYLSARCSAAEALGDIGDISAVPFLIKIAESNIEFLSGYATNALGRIGDKSAVSSLIEALKHGDRGLGITAAWALGNIGDTSAVPFLIESLSDDASDINLKYRTAEALGKMGDKSAVPILLRRLDFVDEWVVGSVTEALRKIGCKYPISELIEIVKDKSPDIRRRAQNIWGIKNLFVQINDTEAIEKIMPLVKNMISQQPDRAIDRLGSTTGLINIYETAFEHASGDTENNIFWKWNKKGKKIKPLGLFPLSKPYWNAEPNIEPFLESGLSVQITTKEASNIVSYSWLSDSERIFFVTDKEFYITNYDGSNIQKIGIFSSKVLPDLTMDGKRIAFIKNKSTNADALYVLSLEKKSLEMAKEIPFRVKALSWAPDGEKLAYSTKQGVWIIFFSSNEIRRISNEKKVFTFNWSPNNEMLGFSYLTEPDEYGDVEQDGLVYDINSGETISADVTQNRDKFGSLYEYAGFTGWVPDSLHIICSGSWGDVDSSLQIDPLNDSEVEVLGSCGPAGTWKNFSWSPKDNTLCAEFWSSCNVRLQSPSLLVKNMHFDFYKSNVIENAKSKPVKNSMMMFDWAPNGEMIAYFEHNFLLRNRCIEDKDCIFLNLWVSKINFSNPAQVWVEPYNVSFPRWSPDGRKIAFFSRGKLFVKRFLTGKKNSEEWKQYYELGKDLFKKENYSNAVISLRDAVRLKPDAFEPRFILGKVYLHIASMQDDPYVRYTFLEGAVFELGEAVKINSKDTNIRDLFIETAAKRILLFGRNMDYMLSTRGDEYKRDLAFAKQIPELIEDLKSKDEVVRKYAADALIYIHDSSAVPALTEALKDSDSEVRKYAAWALNAIENELKSEEK